MFLPRIGESGINWSKLFGNIILDYRLKLKICVTCDPAVFSHLGEYFDHVHQHKNVHRSDVCNSKKLATAQMFIDNRITYGIAT